MGKLILIVCILFQTHFISFGQASFVIPLHCGSKHLQAVKYFDAGNYCISNKQIPKAIKLFLAAIQLDSNFCDAWDNLSTCYREEGDYRSAFISGLHSIVIDSNNPTGWTNCGYAAFYGGDIEKALHAFNRLQSIKILNPEGYFGKSLVLYSIDSFSAALVDINRAERLYKMNKTQLSTEFFLLKGFIEYKLDNKKDAIEFFRRAYDDFSDSPELNYYYGDCINEIDKKPKSAQKFIDRAIKLGYIVDNDSLKTK